MLAEPANGREYHVYFGTYTGAKSKGIYVSRFDADTGKLAPAQLAAEIPSPSFLAVHPGNRFLYAVNEVSKYDGKAAGSVSAFSIDAASGKLALLNAQSSGGPGPCHLVVDKAGRNVLVANYGGGSVEVLPITKSGLLEAASAFVQHTGSSVNKSRQEAPHAHGIRCAHTDRGRPAGDPGHRRTRGARSYAARVRGRPGPRARRCGRHLRRGRSPVGRRRLVLRPSDTTGLAALHGERGARGSGR